MNEITQIILKLLWRFYPTAWLTTTIVRALARITSWLEDEESWVQLAHSCEDCAFVGGWLALAEERLNELIVRKAMKLLKRPYYPSRPCGHHMVRAVRTPQEIYRRLCRLAALYHDHRRLYEKRAQKLQRLFAEAELQLEAIHHPCQTQPATTTIFQFRSWTTTIFPFRSTTTTIFSAPHPAQPIRAPPWPGSRLRTQPIPTREATSRDRETMPEMKENPIAYRLLPIPNPNTHRCERGLPSLLRNCGRGSRTGMGAGRGRNGRSSCEPAALAPVFATEIQSRHGPNTGVLFACSPGP